MVRSILLSLCTLVAVSSAAAQTTTRVSVDSRGAQGDHDSWNFPVLSADGRYVAFFSSAYNLVPGDTNELWDVFVHDRATGATTLVSVDSAGNEGNDLSGYPCISADGRYVAYDSYASNLVPGDTTGYLDVFVYDRQTGTTTCASVSSNGQPGNWDSFGATISADGRYVAFQSKASNLVPNDTNFQIDIFLHDMQTGVTTRVSVNDADGVQALDSNGAASISGDGRYVAFTSYASNLVAGDTNHTPDVFVRDTLLGTTTRVSVTSAGEQVIGQSDAASISADGRYVAFTSTAPTLVPGDTNNSLDVFVHDRLTGSTIRASVDSSGVEGNQYSWWPCLSADGRFVSFHSRASNLVPGDTNGHMDIFVRDLRLGITTRVNLDNSGAQANDDSTTSALSADGRFIVFQSLASNLVSDDTNGLNDIFVRDRGDASAFASFCLGDGTGAPCPCSNAGQAGHGCENSFATGGAQLSAAGAASLSADTVLLTSSGELPSALSIVLQGGSFVTATAFGDGLRCAGGTLKRSYVTHAVGGTTSAPQTGDPSISTRSATLGDPISVGATRVYQVYYRDSNVGFCVYGFNVTNAIAIAWGG